MKIVNLTAHPVIVLHGSEVCARWEASGVVARLVEVTSAGEMLTTTQGQVPVTRLTYSDAVEGLPDACPGTAYLVSRVLAAARPRPDVFFPWGEVRDTDGQIIGCRALGQFETTEGDVSAE
ncbi:MAG: hypothetical protein L0H25_01735 [Micrococcales bacterium]|nr:hypothetical protein [Micrococcales bacterium]